MPSENVLVRQQEKPKHYLYLKSFRVEQCKDFLQHQCSCHKPYTCFNWHFPNQKRRRPVLNTKDGHFNYSPDQYCTKYDESSGVCSDGDGCPFLHRNLGDSERRYHLRYYKVEMCSGEIDTHGVCTKNGIHCSFAHSPEDRRQPVYDIMEHRIIKGSFTGSSGLSQAGSEGGEGLSQSTDKNFLLAIDPQWSETSYMLAHYKVDPCKTNGRHNMVLCPYYHSAKERRRSLATFKYRAVACAMVKDKDEWGEPFSCDAGDLCSYSHTRMELQYHPDVFRTVACAKEQKSGQCNKRIFCAFAHETTNSSSTKELAKTASSPQETTFDTASKVSLPSGKSSVSESSTETSSLASSTSTTLPCLSPSLTSNGKEIGAVNLQASLQASSSSSILSTATRSLCSQNLLSDIVGGSTISALPSSFFTPLSAQLPISVSCSAAIGHTSVASQLKNSLINLVPNASQSAAALAVGSDQSGLGSPTKDHLLDALDDDFVRDVAKSPPPGFTRKPPANDSLDTMKLKGEVLELQKQLLVITKERDQAIKERNQALNLLDAVKNNPGFDESKFLRCLHSDLDLEKLNLAALFQIQAKLHKDVKLVDQVMRQVINDRCRVCNSKVASVPLFCGHKLCPICYIIESRCPICGCSTISMIH